jgi:hypothetical protein
MTASIEAAKPNEPERTREHLVDVMKLARERVLPLT